MVEGAQHGPTRRLSRLGLLLALLACAAVGRFVVLHSYSLYDDAFIYFRYVESTFAGCPLRYSCGDAPVEGFTSPLYLAALHGVRLLSADLPTGTQLFNAVLLVATFVLAGQLAAAVVPVERRFARGAAALATVGVLALDDYALANSVVGLETALAALVVTALALVRTRAASGVPEAVPRPGRLHGVLLVLAVLARPECAVLVLLWPLVDRPLPWRRMLGPALALGAVAVARYLIFDDVVPNTAHAKSGGSWVHARLGLVYLWDAALDFPLLWLSPLALWVPGARAASRLLLPAALIVALSCLRTGGDTFDYSRFLFPFVPAASALALGGLAAAQRLGRRGPWVAVALAMVLGGRAGVAHTIPEQHGFENVLGYEQLGAYLGRTLPGATIATGAIGAVAYRSGNPVLDLLGLVDRHIARSNSHPPEDRMYKAAIGHERHDADYVLSKRPEVIATITYQRQPFAPGAPLNVRLHAEWELVERIRTGQSEYVPFTPRIAPDLYWLLFLRRDVAAQLLAAHSVPAQ